VKLDRSVLQIVVVVITLLLATGAGLAQRTDCAADVDYVEQAQSASAQGNLDLALSSYDCALRTDAADTNLRLERMHTALLAGDFMTAYSDVFWLNNIVPETILARLDDLRLADDQPELRAFLSIFAVLPDYELALSAAEAMITDDADSAFAYVIRAAAYEGIGDYELSDAAFEQASSLSPDDPQIFGLMAAAQFTTFNIDGMRANAGRALDLAPDIAGLYRLRGFTSMVRGEPAAALEDANRAIELDPDYFAFYILRGNAHRASGSPESALADFDQVVALVPTSSFGYALRAEVLHQMGEMAAAAADLATAVELDTLERIEGAPLVIGEAVTVTMTFGRAFHLPFDAIPGESLRVSAASIEANVVDPLVLILGPDATPLVYNDDADPDNGIYDAQVDDFMAAAGGTYTLVVSHALGGSEGEVEVLVTRD